MQQQSVVKFNNAKHVLIQLSQTQDAIHTAELNPLLTSTSNVSTTPTLHTQTHL